MRLTLELEVAAEHMENLHSVRGSIRAFRGDFSPTAAMVAELINVNSGRYPSFRHARTVIETMVGLGRLPHAEALYEVRSRTYHIQLVWDTIRPLRTADVEAFSSMLSTRPPPTPQPSAPPQVTPDRHTPTGRRMIFRPHGEDDLKSISTADRQVGQPAHTIGASSTELGK